ncbi:MAG: hypothetical protein QNK05_04405 [Myxococcota bacterium]|nr:hypothetical protein [Myxococcota bacterium]
MADEVRHWSQLQERGSDLGLRLLVAITRRFGRALALPGVHVAVLYFWITDALGKRISLGFLARVRQERERRGLPAGLGPDWRASYRHYLEFALAIVDRVMLWGGALEDFTFDIQEPELFHRFQERGRGGIILGAHLGSFDALRVLSVRDRVTVHVLMYTRHAPIVNTVFRELSPDVDLRVIEPTGSVAGLALEIRALVERGEWIGILGDRVEAGESGRIEEIPFLGGEARFPLAPYRMAVQLGCPVVSLLALREGAYHYRVTSEVLDPGKDRLPRAEQDARASEMARAYVRFLERHCLESPTQWYNWFDFWEQKAPEPGDKE